MDIVYVYKSVPSDEIVYSIKSTKNIKHGNLYVIGDDPGIGIHISCDYQPWMWNSKYHNQIAKYLTACNNDISEKFLAFNDDFFIMSPWEPINYNRGTLSNHIRQRKFKDYYTRSLQYTEDYLKSHGYPTLSFELHTPFIYEKSKLKDLILSLPMDRPLQIRSLYGNIYNVKTEYSEDVKNIPNFKNKTLLSTNETTFKGDIGNYIRECLV